MAFIVTMPKLGFDMAEGTLARWVIMEGETVTKGAVLAEIETDKATVEVEAAQDGILTKHLVQAGEIVPINTPIAIIAAQGETVDFSALGVEVTTSEKEEAREIATQPSKVEEKTAVISPEEEGLSRPKASPLAKKIAREKGINLRAVRGSGPEGRVTKKDVLAFLTTGSLKISEATSIATPAPAPSAPSLPPQRVPLNRLRATIGKRMTEAKQQIPHFYVTHEYDVEALADLRRQVNDLLTEEEKISINDFLVKAAALTLRQFPNLNASIEGEQIIRHGEINIGIAVAVEGGLLTVVCRQADQKSVRQISVEVREMVARAREGKVRPGDIEGSTFSVSNLGMYQVEHFIAIINPPEAAILAVGSTRQVPVIKDSEVKTGLRMKATLSVDHRVSDGVEAAKFLQQLATYIQQPLGLLI